MIRYQITSHKPVSHYFDVSIQIDAPDSKGQHLRLPNWIPGSYMIRDFARNLLDLRAFAKDSELAIEQIDKSNWRVAAAQGAVTIEYKVYAKDLSVRAAHLDHSHGYYNGSSVFFEVVGQGDRPCEVLIEKPGADYCEAWQLATSLKRKQAKPFGFGLYEALDYDDLIDHPVEMGTFRRVSFDACGVPHDIILSGRFECDEARLAADLKTICEHHIRFFGEPAPMDYYQFQVMVVGEGYGGLEHRASTSLVASRNSLPKPGQKKVDDDYRDFLGLCSHEYFHTWNVKRIKPAVYQPYALQAEVYTDLLWAFEGITSYYDDLALLRCGLIEAESYLELLAQTMTRVQRGPGRLRQSAAESSFNAWTKFYKQDENAANAIVSYYAKGCLIAACIDLKIRALTGSQQSLDDVMRRLWQEYCEQGRGVETDSIQQWVSTVAGQDLGPFVDELIYGTGELPLVELLESVGIEVLQRVAQNSQDKGGKDAEGDLPAVDFGAVLKDGEAGISIQRVTESRSAQCAGLSAGDQVIAIDGLKLNLGQLEKKLLRASPGDRWQVHAFRRDELHQFDVILQAAEENTFVLKMTDQQQDSRIDWLAS
ncbi:MAG: PDZ domain-containing protein [Gammaproteobacteria bacterium]|nr:PDZ domain-containing protein [Gammaproteobacteria bacterium]MDH3859101.1 PDZ domain-containing protein [Gammaproteobacteria bacterium]